ncbi:hypothetical protein [Urechidicola croceus]|uniref:Lipoprotein n=1 Tax=Urechidicola croceus TaxID=1850246 RepID=A0A1D8PAM6_9FLAO|nr:hypothetical protein [Urechidicola croceus]AOW21638.1 hypothetical protein LPB138_13530 [Urechidicola croceus]
MKTIKKQLRFWVFVLSSVIMIQSCRVYHKETVTLDEAIQKQKRVKIITNDDQKYKFKKVVFEDGLFYGVSMKKGKEVKTQLKVEELKKVRLHNKKMSIIYGILTPIVVIFGVLYIGFSNWKGPNIGPINFPN